MAAPITTIQKHIPTKEELQQQKLEDLKALLTENEEAMSSILKIAGELNEAGVLDAANAMLQAKEKIAKIALGQVTREPVTSIINHFIGAAGVLTSLDPEMTSKVTSSIKTGLEEGNQHLETNSKINILDLLRALQDPDINRAVGFGLHFLKGIGKGLKEDK
ncbi:DUF1641 domain-containing protein [Mesobacillus foraminis]|uniref:DUF1641 domain-containing protein n=1 Tax=Mesobacillus foraminis TaxID=279826 RepID=UPI00399F8FD3